MVKDWLQLQGFHPDAWQGFQDVKSRWYDIVHDALGRRKSMNSLTMLVAWELCNRTQCKDLQQQVCPADHHHVKDPVRGGELGVSGYNSFV